MAGCKRLALLAVLLGFAFTASLRAGAANDASVGSGRSARVTIGLPPGDDPAVSFAFGDGKLAIDLPRGATFPFDFERESDGLLRGGTVTTVSDSRVRLDLSLASGVVNGIDVGPQSVVIRLTSRFTAAELGSAEGAQSYRLGPDDKVQIAINGRQDMTQQVVVNRGGTLTVPFVGEVAVAGLTVREAAARITDLLARDYLVDPKVDVQVLEYKSSWVMVTGSVGKPGRVALRGGATLKDVLSDADGLTMDAGDSIGISREAGDGAGKIQIPVDRTAFERAEIDPPMQSGDIVNVPPRPYVYVLGEVRSPQRVPLERGMTLLKAISVAGGLTEWASQKGVQVISEDAKGEKKTYNLKSIRSLKTPDPLLKWGDRVYVDRRFL